MDPIESLHHAIGELAYAVAFADGKVQKEERRKFESIAAVELRCKDYFFEISDIAFKLNIKEKTDVKSSYGWAMKEIKLNSHYLSPQLKQTFITVMQKIAKAFPPVKKEEQYVIDKFKSDIETINGDPVFYLKDRL